MALLAGIILTFIYDYIITLIEGSGGGEIKVEEVNEAYSKAIRAMESGDTLNAFDYVNTGLEDFPKHLASLALKIN